MWMPASPFVSHKDLHQISPKISNTAKILHQIAHVKHLQQKVIILGLFLTYRHKRFFSTHYIFNKITLVHRISSFILSLQKPPMKPTFLLHRCLILSVLLSVSALLYHYLGSTQSTFYDTHSSGRKGKLLHP